VPASNCARVAGTPNGRYTRLPVRAVIVVPEPSVWSRAGAPGGLSLLERLLKQVRSLGLEALVLVPDEQPRPVVPAELAVELRRIAVTGSDPLAVLAAAADLPDDFVFASADRLVDLRVLRALVAASGPVMATVRGVVEPVGRLRRGDVERDGVALPLAAPRLAVESLDPYVRELRGRVPAYVLRVRTGGERRRAWRVLLAHVQKQTLDLPGQYFDTPFENALVRRLAPTRVTPNQITLATTLLAVAVGGLFLAGRVGAALPLALVVGILDGVDGKLARLKLATSKLGELEHVADFFYENLWYLGLGAHLRATTGVVTFWYAALLLVGFDLLDNLVYAAVQARTGCMLDEMTPFDRRFRKVAGRRNVYVMLFTAGALGAHVPLAFLAAAVWAGVTACVHAGRGLRLVLASERPSRTAHETRAAFAQVPEIDSAAGLVSDK
jgi:phosphatidylglycerophosphate synthase